MLKQAERSLIKLYIAIALSDFHIAPDRISTHHQVGFPHYTRSDRVDLVKGIRDIFSLGESLGRQVAGNQWEHPECTADRTPSL